MKVFIVVPVNIGETDPTTAKTQAAAAICQILSDGVDEMLEKPSFPLLIDFESIRAMDMVDQNEETPDKNSDDEHVVCKFCKQLCNAKNAHLHQGEYVGDECCWDERLRGSE